MYLLLVVVFVLSIGNQLAVDHLAVNHIVLGIEVHRSFNALITFGAHHGFLDEVLSRS